MAGCQITEMQCMWASLAESGHEILVLCLCAFVLLSIIDPAGAAQPADTLRDKRRERRWARTDNATEADMDQQAKDVRRKLVNLYQRWGKVHKIPDNEDIRAHTCNQAKASSRFTRIVQRKNLPWEKDSIARAAYDPAHIPDCNVQAMVGQHLIFSEPIPKAENGRGYLRVTKKSLWWQTAQFPTVWTSEELTTCMEKGYQFTINSTTWNHLRMLWQAPPLDLLSLVYQETHVQNILEASGYRTPTWRILRALQSTPHQR
jgi:hypothetical protein